MLIFAASKSAEAATSSIAFMPAWWKIAILFAVLLELAGISFFIKRKWLESQEALPVSVALTLLFMVFSLYFLVSSILYWTSSHKERGPLLMWLVLFLIPVCVQYAMNLVNAISWEGSQRLTAVGTKIPEAPAITQAHLLLQDGKMTEALEVLTDALMARPRALEIVARWYRSEGDYEKAVSLYQEVLEISQEDADFWSEAAYNLGKLYETFLEEPHKAITLFRRVSEEMPESRFCSLAEADLARLQLAYGQDFALSDADTPAAPSRQMDFWEQRRAMLQRQSPPEIPVSEAEKEEPPQAEE